MLLELVSIFSRIEAEGKALDGEPSGSIARRPTDEDQRLKLWERSPPLTILCDLLQVGLDQMIEWSGPMANPLGSSKRTRHIILRYLDGGFQIGS